VKFEARNVEVCTCKRAVIVKMKDKNEQIIEKFYTRSGNLSQELPLSEMNIYFKERFHS
jgi:hypothetical protein